MKRRNATRNALFTSILSLLLCVSMLVGTTYAWFTDEVNSGMNTITAGNLDVELFAGDTQVDENTKLFANVKLWEPGVVVYENLKVVNKGNLALKYRMTLNIGDENDVDGHKLSEVLKIAIIDKIDEGADRQTVLAAAQAVVAQDQGMGTLSNFMLNGTLDPEAESEEKTFVIFWAPNDNETDNLYNVNNGKTTSDGKPLHIEFGVNLVATQQMYEGDSFGTDYDKYSSILPKATVNDLGAQTVPVWQGYSEDEIALDTSFQFLPNETEDEARENAYRHYVADYVIKADRDVPADSIALAGYYDAFCSTNGWIILTNEGAKVAAGEEIRLVQALGAEVTYFNICQFGNDGIGFLCGVKDLTGENAGTTITVELRLFETTTPPSSSSFDGGTETGKYEVVGTYTYTFPMKEKDNVIFVRNAEELQEAVDTASDGSVIAFASDITGDVTVTQRADVSLTINGCGKTFTGLMTVFGDGRQSGAEALAIKDVNFVAKAGASSCIYSPDRADNNKYSYAHNVTVEGCDFTDPDGVVNCAAIRHGDGGDKNWTVRSCSVDNTMHSLLQINNVAGKLIVDKCVVNSKNGINLNSCTDVEIIGCIFDVQGYCVRFGVNSGGNAADVAKNFLIKECTLKTANDDGDAAIIFRADAANGGVLTLEGTTISGTPEISGNTANTTIVRN